MKTTLSRFALSIPALLVFLPAAAAGQACDDVTWLNPNQPPAFLTDVDQAKGTGNCQFHEFASNNFMSLVLGDTPHFESWPTTENALPASGWPICGGVPMASSLTNVIDKTASELVAKQRSVRSNLDLKDILEATGQPLVDQNGRYVQFEIRVNPTMCQTLTRCELYTTNCVTAALEATPEFRWPSGALSQAGVAEIKLAWRVMETCDLPDSPPSCQPDDLPEFFWVDDVTVSQYSPKIESPVSNLTLGLVGFHLIQKTPSHPEMIWATWEHISNDPVCTGSANAECQDPSKATSGVSTSSHWSLIDPRVANFDLCTAPNHCVNESYFEKASPEDQPITEVCRKFPCGGGDQTEIQQLNNAIRSRLSGNVWWNYFLVGTVWGKNTSTPTGPTDSAGSIQLANTTMETYFQDKANNCFTCHQSQPSLVSEQQRVINLDFVHSLIKVQQQGQGACGVDFSTCAVERNP